MQADGRHPAGVFWVHKVTGRISSTASSRSRWPLPRELVSRSTCCYWSRFDPTDRRNQDLCDELESRIRTWVAFASGDDAKLSTKLYSEVLTEAYLAERGWAAINDYLNPRIGVLDFLVASKAISPQQYTTNPEESVQALLQNARTLGSGEAARAAA